MKVIATSARMKIKLEEEPNTIKLKASARHFIVSFKRRIQSH
ncbi:hypothetical protein HanIR_Chr05g0222111 [Helianthus annuus]|nr:hypothetical protein HanIR_Chr05g0222111 [Helianthus annuus]